MLSGYWTILGKKLLIFKKVLSKLRFIDKMYCVNCYGVIGEVVNTADCGSVMQEFDPLIAPHFKNY